MMRVIISSLFVAALLISLAPQNPLEKLKEQVPWKKKADTGDYSKASKDAYLKLAREKKYVTDNFPHHTNRSEISNKAQAENYARLAEELDYPNTRLKLEEGVRKFPAIAEEYDVKLLLQEFPSRFAMLSEHFLSEANRFIEVAYQTQSKNRLRAAEFAEGAVILTNAVLSVVPNDTRALAVKRDAEAAVNRIGGALAASVYTSPFHKANAGKMVFFGVPVDIKQENPSAVAVGFKAGDYIYSIAYLKASFKDQISLPNRSLLKAIKLRLFIDGNEYQDFGGFPASITWEQYQDAGTTYLKVDVVPDPSVVNYPNPSQYDPVIKYAKVLGQSSPRKHRIQLKLDADGKIVAEGEFDLDLSMGQDKILAIADKLREAKLSKVFLPKPRMTNAALERSMAAALKEQGWKEAILRVVVTDSQWTIHRNAFGAIEFRSIGAAAAMKGADGVCKYFTLSFKQDYRGGGFGKTQQYGVGDNFEMACSNVNQ
ncbi:MAG: hypothetical protein AB1631_20530 [Acidobacteriota bacterium]